MEAARDKAVQTKKSVRFYTYLSGEYIPCWASSIEGKDGAIYTMIALDKIDWSASRVILDKFREEMKDAISSTQGHVDLITKTIGANRGNAEELGKRVGSFNNLIGVHMHRVGRLIEMLERLEDIRTGKIREVIQERKRKIELANYLEDFVEELDEIMLVDPETEARDHRSRITVDVPDKLAALASSAHLTRILHDLLRNAIMYSMRATPIKIKVSAKNQSVQIDVVDEGYGVRAKEIERVFDIFQRARQPQIIAEFGYGLSLYLCKHEVEAMNGRMWFESEEHVGTTFSFMLPVWQEETTSSSSSDSK